MTPAALKQAETTAAAACTRLRLPLHRKTWRGQAGEFTGSGTGSSLDFQEHLAYAPGDDPRHINWQAYARTGHYTMKLFREEVCPSVDLILDASESMFFDPTKAARTAELLYFTWQSCLLAGIQPILHALRGDANRLLCELIDAESLSRQPCRIESTTIRRYRDAYTAHFALWSQSCRRYQATLARIPAETPLLRALFQHALPHGAVESAG